MFRFTWKTYLQCFSTIKCLPVTVTTLPDTSSPENTNLDQNHTTSTTLMKNFNPLCDLTSTSTSNLTSSADHDLFSNASDVSSDGDDLPPDFATVFASQRFFFSSPGHSNSIIELPNSPQDPEINALVPDSIAIQTYSPDPLQDFRKSMQEMVEAHGIVDVKADWEFLHELLLCYLTLNPKQTHKFIIKAFSDVLVSLVSSENCRKIEDRHHGTVSPRLV